MSEFVQTTLFLLTYRAITIAVGLAIIYLGYRLFCVGIYEKAGELKAVWGDKKFILKQVAPGTFFVLLGALIIAISIWRDIDLEKTRKVVSESSTLHPSSIESEPTEEVELILKKVANDEKISEKERGVLRKWLVKEEMKFRALKHKIEGQK